MFGLRLGKLGAALKAGSGSVGVTPLFSRDYEATGSLGADATFTRSSSATIVDHEGVIRTVPSGAARFNGLRYVRNLFANTTTSLASGSSTTAVTVTAGSYIFSMGAGSGTATFSGTATGSTGTLSANASNRTAKTLTITAGGTIIVTASVAALATIQLENATGRTVQGTRLADLFAQARQPEKAQAEPRAGGAAARQLQRERRRHRLELRAWLDRLEALRGSLARWAELTGQGAELAALDEKLDALARTTQQTIAVLAGEDDTDSEAA